MEDSLREIGIAAARLFRGQAYADVQLDEIASSVRLPRQGRGRRPKQQRESQGRSPMWLYGVIQSKGQAVALGASVTWHRHLTEEAESDPAAPGTLRGARESVTAALDRAARFAGQEDFLFIQLQAGLSDLPHRRNTVPRHWPDSPYGRVAAAAAEGRCGVFADALVPVLDSAFAPIGPGDRPDTALIAGELSDLVFRTVLNDRAATSRSIATGLTGYWFQRYVVHDESASAHGTRRLDDAERALTLFPSGSSAGRLAAAICARAVLATGRAHRRAVSEYTQVATDMTAAREWPEASDAASRLALAQLRWGDLPAAATWAARSREVAVDHLGAMDERVPRADTLAAETAIAAGDPAQGLALARTALEARKTVHREVDTASSWRRLSLSQGAYALALACSGRVSEAVSEAAFLLADRQRRLGPGREVPAPTLDATRVLSFALLEQGALSRARELAVRTLENRKTRGESAHMNTQRVVADLARALILLGSADQAEGLLKEAPGGTDWFATRVSFRLACSIWRYHAEALLSGPGTVDLAEVNRLLARCEEILASHRVPEDDPLRFALGRTRARAEQADGRPETALDILRTAHDRQSPLLGPAHPRSLALTCETAALEIDRGDLDLAEHRLLAVAATPETQVDRTHPYRLAAQVGLARIAASRDEDPAAFLTDLSAAAPDPLPLDPDHPVAQAATGLMTHHGKSALLPEAQFIDWDQ